MKENLKYNISSTNFKIAAFLGLILSYPRVNAEGVSAVSNSPSFNY